MRRLLGPAELAAIHLALCGLVLVWDLIMAGRIARLRSTPPAMAALSAVGGLLLLPSLAVLLVSTSVLTGRALYTVAWAWPLTAILIALQAAYAVARGMAAPAIGGAIAAYDVLVAVIAIARYAVFAGIAVPEPLLFLVAAERDAMAHFAASRALLLPHFLLLPIVAPATPGRRGAGTVLRSAVATLAATWGVLVVLSLPAATSAVQSYGRYAAERLQERPDSDFVVGLKIFPTLEDGPPPLSLRDDLELADSIRAGALSVYIAPRGASNVVLDSLEHSLQDERANKKLIVALDLSGEPTLRTRAARVHYLKARVADAERIARRLTPDLLVPVVDPNGAADRALGAMPLEMWESYLRDAALAVHRVSPTVHVMAHVGGVGARDSTLYAWAASAESPVDNVAISLFPWLGGAATLDFRMRTIDEWLSAAHSPKEHWVLEAGAFPLVHGEQSQERAVWGALAWATSRSSVKGLILFESGDYSSGLGLRAPGGRIRPAAPEAARAIRALGRAT